MTSPLDRPIWSALDTRHASLAVGGTLARRYDPTVSLFAATADDEPESLDALGQLLQPGETLRVVQTGTVTIPKGFVALSSASLVQMTLEQPLAEIADPRIELLGWPDAEEMLALATETRPGPFTAKSLAFGDFWGIRIDGRLVAMAGERMKLTGHTELSGVCVHADHRGKGYARLLSLFIAGRLQAAGERVFLHSFATNTAAIGLYNSFGFRIRAELNTVIIGRAE